MKLFKDNIIYRFMKNIRLFFGQYKFDF